MTFTFSATLATNRDKIRDAIGDVTAAGSGHNPGIMPDGSNVSDESIALYLGLVDNDWQKAVPLVLRAVANRYAMEARSKTGDDEEDLSEIAAHLREQADAWELGMPIDWSSLLHYHDTDADGESPPFPFGEQQWGTEIVDQRRDE